MSAANLTPISAFDDAEAKLRAAAKQMLTLVSVTLHRQLPTGAFLVLTRPIDHDDEDSVLLDSVRDAQGEILHEFDDWAQDAPLLPAVAEDLTALWGQADPRNPSEVLNLIQRVDAVARYEFLSFLPSELRTDDEIEAEDGGGRTALGIPLAPVHCPVHGPMCEPDDHVEPPTVHGQVV